MVPKPFALLSEEVGHYYKSRIFGDTCIYYHGEKLISEASSGNTDSFIVVFSFYWGNFSV